MRRFALTAACFLTLAGVSVARAAEPEAKPPAAQAEVRIEKVQLEYADPGWALRVLLSPTLAAAEMMPSDGKAALGATLEGGPTGSQRHLVPEGIQSLLAFPTDASVLVRGTAPAIRQFRSLIRLLDVPPRGTSNSRPNYRLTLQSARPELVRDLLRELSDDDKTTVEIEGKILKLEGSPAWMHRALRVVVRLEMSEIR